MVKKPVVEELMQSLPATLILALASTLFMLVFSLPLGIYSAVKRNSVFDYAVKVQRELSPLDGIKKRVGDKVEVVYARGYVGDARGEYNGVVTGQNLKDDRTPEELIAEAVKVAEDADYVIFIGGLNKSNNQDCEDTDRAGQK